MPKGDGQKLIFCATQRCRIATEEESVLFPRLILPFGVRLLLPPALRVVELAASSRSELELSGHAQIVLINQLI